MDDHQNTPSRSPRGIKDMAFTDCSDVAIEAYAKRVFPTECHACREKMCPTAEQCDQCNAPEKPARRYHSGGEDL